MRLLWKKTCFWIHLEEPFLYKSRAISEKGRLREKSGSPPKFWQNQLFAQRSPENAARAPPSHWLILAFLERSQKVILVQKNNY